MSYRVKASGRLFQFPSICSCCGAPAQTSLSEEASKRRGRQRKTKEFDFPYCVFCVAHVKADEAFFGSPVTGPSCVCSGMACDFVEWDGSVNTFDFESPSFASAFRQANASKIVDGNDWQSAPAPAIYPQVYPTGPVYPAPYQPAPAALTRQASTGTAIVAVIAILTAACLITAALNKKNQEADATKGPTAIQPQPLVLPNPTPAPTPRAAIHPHSRPRTRLPTNQHDGSVGFIGTPNPIPSPTAAPVAPAEPTPAPAPDLTEPQ